MNMSTKITAMPHQIEAIRMLTGSRGFLLADDMGLGKTYTALLAAKQLGKATTVICPAFLTSNWIKSAQKLDMIIACHSYNQAPKNLQATPEILIIDESHYIKNMKSLRSKFCLDLAELVKKKGGCVWLLTGTPVTKDADDLYSQLLAIDAVPVGKNGKPWSLWGWKNAVMNQIPDRYTTTGIKHKGISDAGQQRLTEMRKGKYLRRKKDEVLTLPPKIHTTIYTGESTKALQKELAAFDSLTVEELQKSTHFMSVRAKLAELKAKKVAKGIAEELAESPKQLVIFSAHVAAVEALASVLTDAAVITGATSPDQRAKIVEQFQAGKIQTLIATIGAAGTGITLTASHDVRFIDRSFSPAENAQAEDRCYRIGQDEKLTVTDYITNDDIELRILEILLEKQAIIAATE